ncbi:M14 family zinc carboxypeptidase [Actinomadura sp. CNU-125]|uniref:M14 family zinc carboxypeptidase n=1 Tax=Actinomadura sp. CNU-125 TaxID=1904961 RepID=UPI001300D073|nr:M14 family zinc carboxypeptidase [Actinomadura sp. CNU-125]
MTRTLFRHRRLTPILAAGALLIGVLTAAPATAAPAPRASGGTVDVYTAELSAAQMKILDRAGLAREDVQISEAGEGEDRVRVEAVLNDAMAAELNRQGLGLKVKKVDGKDARARAKAAPDNVFRPYSGAGNIHEELLRVASENPSIAKAVDIGKSHQGKPITAVRVSKDVANLQDGQRPVILYQATQHAREWITTEMVRRLLHHYVDGYGTDPEITKIVDSTDLWFVPVTNVDGYDLTFEDGFRLWRKNVRDNDGDGQIGGQDGVDLNRNFPYKWGYDN